jgi:glucose/arabinose dehydrogenase
MKFCQLSLGVTALMFTSCAEPQIEANLPSRPASEFNIEAIADDLTLPWSVAVLPDGSYLVSEKTGALKRIGADGTATNISGLPENIHVDQQGGLLDVALAPDFEINNTIFLSFTTGTKKANATALFKARLDGETLMDGEVIFTAGPTKDTGAHFGGRIAFLPDGSLILTLGDGFAYREAAQDLKSHLGKIVRLTQDGFAPDNNPYVGGEELRPEIYSYGHRNVQGLHYDAIENKLWAHEHGPQGGDELNLIESGNNYGWPLATTGVDYNGAKITPHKTHPGTEAYVKDWVPSIAPSGLTIYRGEMFGDWDGDALVGGLKTQDLRRLNLEDGKYISEEVLLEDLEVRIRDVRTAPDGAILILTDDETSGQLLRITPKDEIQ